MAEGREQCAELIHGCLGRGRTGGCTCRASDVCMKCRAAVMPLDAVLNMAACKAGASLLQDWGERAAAVADSRAELLYGLAV